MKKSEEPDYHYRTRQNYIYVAVKRAVMRGQEMVAQAVSHTFARRIAEALNHYTPGRKGY